MHLRELDFSDTDHILNWLQDAENRCFFAGDDIMPTRREVEQFIFSALYVAGNIYRVLSDDVDDFWGLVALKDIDPTTAAAEFAIALLPAARGRGYAMQATDLLLRFAFNEVGLVRIYMYTSVENDATIRFNERYGFLPQEGPFQQIAIRGKLHDVKWYGMTKAQFLQIRQTTAPVREQ